MDSGSNLPYAVWLGGALITVVAVPAQVENLSQLRSGSCHPRLLHRQLLEQQQLVSYEFNGFWKSMDTLAKKQELDYLLRKGNAPWATAGEGGRLPRNARA
jgi:hypothetical protein